MAIKESIPRMLRNKETYTQMAMNDIREAVEKHIESFEFEGDYNYKTLASIARQQVSRFFREYIFLPAARNAKKILAEEGFVEISLPNERHFRYGENIVQIFGVTLEDRVHVYGKIYFNNLDNFYDDFLIKAREMSSKRKRVD